MSRSAAKTAQRTRAVKTAGGVLLAAALVAVILLNLFTHVFAVVRYYGDGMEPTLSGGQTLVLLRTDEVDEGDVIAFYYNNKILVRRVICEGGKQISISGDGTVYVDGEVLAEPYLTAPSLGQCNLSFPHYVTPGEYFVMGDNRAVAMDSRLSELGTVPEERILGKLLFSF